MEPQSKTGRLSQARSRLFSCAVLLAAAGGIEGRAGPLEKETAQRIDQLRSIQAGRDAATTAAYNKQMDAAWQFFSDNKVRVLPTLRSELKTEFVRHPPNDLVLLDVGFFLYRNDGAEGKAVGIDALAKLNPRAPVITANIDELFRFTYAVAQDHNPRVLAIIENAFLPSRARIFIPQHALQLDGTAICVFLYGVYGSEAEDALRLKLQDPAVSRRVLEVLVWLGSPSSLPEVRRALVVSPDDDTFARVAAYMMQAAGPAGRDFLLGLADSKLESKARQYLTKIRPEIERMSLESYRSTFASFPGDKGLPDTEVAARLDAMIKHAGKDDRTSPLAVLDSGLGSAELIAQLLKVRSQTFLRLSDEALDDVQITNALINALRYRGK
jgi:hypothetical protein